MARTNRGIVKVYAGTDGIPTVEVGSGLPGAPGQQGLPGAGGPGSTVVGNVVTWNSTNGTVLADGGIALSALAPKASPALTGIPTAPTAAAATNTTQIATTAMVQSALAAYIAAQDVLVFKGVIDCSINPNYPAADAGWVYKVSVAGKIGGASGTNVEVGDVLTCLVDGSAAGTQAAVGANWIVSQVNIDGAVTGPVSSTDASVAGFNGTTGKIIKALTAAEIRTAAALATGDSPQFTGVNIGHATDTTITRISAGVIAVEGVEIVTTTGTQTLSGKSLSDSTTFFVDEADATKKVQIAAELVSSGTTRVLTAPNRSGVLLTDPTAATDILPTLDLDFTNINGAPFAGNLTRATAGGYRQNSKGVYVATAVNEPVIDFSAGTALGTGFYGAYTNLLLYSEQLDNAAWFKSGATISANAVVAPDGTATMDGLIESATNAQHLVSQSTSKAASSITYTVAFFARAGLGRRVLFQIFGTAYAGGAQATFDPETGTMTAAAAVYGTGFSSAAANFAQVSSGLYLVWLTATSDTTTAISYQANLANGGSISYLGDGVSGAYMWGFSLTATAFPVPYVPTTSATVARNADSMVISGTDFTDFFNPVESTLYADCIVPRDTNFPGLFQIDDGTSNNRHFMFWNGINIVGATVVGGVTQANPALAGVAGASVKVAMVWKANNFNTYVNGLGGTLDTSGTVPTGLTRLKIGLADAAWNEHIRRLIYWPKALTATELQRMTA